VRQEIMMSTDKDWAREGWTGERGLIAGVGVWSR
jgi:hypothetical protein